jgi:hypothetical protein
MLVDDYGAYTLGFESKRSVFGQEAGKGIKRRSLVFRIENLDTTPV